MVPIYIYIYIYIYILLSSTDRPVSLHQNSSVWLDRLDSRSWDRNQSKFLPLSHEETSASEGNLNAYVSHLYLFTYICLTATDSSIHMKYDSYSLTIPCIAIYFLHTIIWFQSLLIEILIFQLMLFGLVWFYGITTIVSYCRGPGKGH